ncbi:MAG: hypothetical protein K2X67_06020 [Burkholderiales bacterium]|nr:hypothetical protein [Burkholderiales bacterium]
MKRAKRLYRPVIAAHFEPAIRQAFNEQFGFGAERRTVTVGRKTASHEFALHDAGKVLGTIVPSSNRAFEIAATEILWLCLWEGPERRVVITSELELAQEMITAFHGCYFPTQIEAFHFDAAAKSFYRAGRLGAD